MCAVFYDNRHFSVLRPAETDAEARFDPIDGTGGLAEAGLRVEDEAGVRFIPVPADGNCLITAIYFIVYDEFPTPEMIRVLRAAIAKELKPDQILRAVAEMKADLIENAAERPFENGTFIISSFPICDRQTVPVLRHPYG